MRTRVPALAVPTLVVVSAALLGLELLWLPRLDVRAHPRQLPAEPDVDLDQLVAERRQAPVRFRRWFLHAAHGAKSSARAASGRRAKAGPLLG